ncbi:MAG: ATP-dependent DNA helicase RecG [Melioribacteraceae bacterium]|nr:MAG: ATP-dependent DNA helicase RecG [Melioribacteraceae bacterium]
MSGTLDSKLDTLNGIGKKRAEAFEHYNINNVEDLLFYFPVKHLDRSNITKSSELKKYVANGYDGEATLLGFVIKSEEINYGKKSMFKVLFKDGNGTFECVWFNAIKYFSGRFNAGDNFAVAGKPVLTKYGNLQFAHPDFDKITDEESENFKHTGKIIPFYSIPKKLKELNLGDFGLRNIIREAVEVYADSLTETLPPEILKSNQLLPVSQALKEIHYPRNLETLQNALRRFKYEELFYFEILVALKKHKIRNLRRGVAMKANGKLVKPFLESLPFKLTQAQLKVLAEIRADMEIDKPMNRLIQGDVGSGKTIVAILAMLIAAENGYQSAIMVPTEILANQHYDTLKKMVSRFGVNVVSLIGGQTKAIRAEALADIKSHKANIVIGTHALIEDTVEFDKLGLIVIDEQHRFGVTQRSKLRDKADLPDCLVMTATPIPRTLSMTLYGDLDVSTIDKMPANRKPIRTVIRGESSLRGIYKFILDKHEEGYQSYIVYPMVEESEKIDLKAATTHYEELSKTFFKNRDVGLIHGKMKWNEKQEMMKRFADKEFDILIATTVIEVGIDVPDANIIVINDAYRYGLSQLHQLRGRVGRGSKQGFCILLASDEYTKQLQKFDFNLDYLSPAKREKIKSILRLNSMVKTSDGFLLSEIDMKLRGPGDIFGTKQSGFPELKIADINKDTSILVKAKQDAFEIINDDPNLVFPGDSLIKTKLLKSYKGHLKFSSIA